MQTKRKRGLYDEANPRHRKIVTLAALGHTRAEVCAKVPCHLSTYQRVKNCPEGRRAMKKMLDKVDLEIIRLSSATAILRAF